MVVKPPPSPLLIPPVVRNKKLLAQHTHPPTHPTTQVSKMDPGLKQALHRQRIKSEGAVPDIKNVKKSQEGKKTGGSSVKKKKKKEDTEKLKKASLITMKMSTRLISWLKKADSPQDEECSVRKMIRKHEESRVLLDNDGQTNPTVGKTKIRDGESGRASQDNEHAGEQVDSTGGDGHDAGGD